MKRLFQECKIAKGNATVLSEMLAYAKPEQIEGSLIPVRVISQLTPDLHFVSLLHYLCVAHHDSPSSILLILI